MAQRTEERIANGLGWFSVGLGVAEIVAPGAVANLIGIRNKPKTRSKLRGYGFRELTAGIGILTRPRPSKWVWGRVAGDMVDLATLGSALGERSTNKTRAVAATVAVVGVTALDIYCGQQLSTQKNGASDTKSAQVTKTITVGSSPEQAYEYWSRLENLPQFMTYLESVRATGGKRSHWTAIGPGGSRIEWDAETTLDEPNRTISWRSVDSTKFQNSGSVKFGKATGDRGTLVTVEMQYSPAAGTLPSFINKMLGTDLEQRIGHDLRNFKQMLELGEVTQSDASIHKGMHPAQPAAASLKAA